MKKNSILKALGITFLIVVLLSWIIPAGTYNNGTYTASGSTLPIGLYDFIRVPVLTIATFIQYGLFLLVIGGFYGVLNQTVAYSNIINNIVEKWSNKKKTFIIIITLLFALLTSLTGLTHVMFILVPFFIAILLKLGYNKLISFTATVGSILVGNIGCTLGFNVWGWLKTYFSSTTNPLSMTTLIFARVVLLIMAVALFIILISKNTKEEKETKKSKKASVDIPLFEEVKDKKNSLPLIILSIILFVLLIVGSYNWYYAFDIEFFNNLHTNIQSFKIGEYTLFNNLFAIEHIPSLGFFENYDVAIILIFASFIIGWTYSIKVKDIVSNFAKGAKEMLLPYVYAMLSCVVFACVLNMSNGIFINTIIDKLLDAEKFSFMGTVGTSLITSFVYNDFPTLISRIVSLFATYDANVIPVILFIIQGMFGLISLIAPTSIYLVAGLSYMDISYKEWIKHIWKYALILFGIIIVVAFILTTLM